MLVFAVIWAMGVGLWFAFGPRYSTAAVSSSTADVAAAPSSSPPHATEGTASGLVVNGAPLLLLVLGIPVVLAVAPLAVRSDRQRRVAGVAAVLMLAGAVVAAFSVGLLYIPTAVALGVAAAWPVRRPRMLCTGAPANER